MSLSSKLKKVFRDEPDSPKTRGSSDARTSSEMLQRKASIPRKPVPGRSTIRAVSGQSGQSESENGDDLHDMEYLVPAMSGMQMEDQSGLPQSDPASLNLARAGASRAWEGDRGARGEEVRGVSNRADQPDIRGQSRDVDQAAAAPNFSRRAPEPQSRGHARQASLQKPLPPPPPPAHKVPVNAEQENARALVPAGTAALPREQGQSSNDITPPPHRVPVRSQQENARPTGPQSISATALAREQGRSVKDIEKELGVRGVLDLRNTKETHIHEKMLPAVTHETVFQDVHEIRTEEVTREIHEHHVIHRILPIEDIEVLPARHYIYDDDRGFLKEVGEDQLQGRDPYAAERAIRKGLKKSQAQSSDGPVGPRQFTARTFEGTEGDYREGVAREGGHRLTEQWWVHPPELEEGGIHSGQTYPVHLGSENPADDGLRTKVVAV